MEVGLDIVPETGALPDCIGVDIAPEGDICDIMAFLALILSINDILDPGAVDDIIPLCFIAIIFILAISPGLGGGADELIVDWAKQGTAVASSLL